jgi:hypothetical protein
MNVLKVLRMAKGVEDKNVMQPMDNNNNKLQQGYASQGDVYEDNKGFQEMKIT